MNFFSHALLLATFIICSAVACTNTCASDSDCNVDSVCLIDIDGPHCTSIELAAQVLPESEIDVSDSGDVVLRDVSVSFAPEARTGTIVMRPLSVVVTRSTRSSP